MKKVKKYKKTNKVAVASIERALDAMTFMLDNLSSYLMLERENKTLEKEAYVRTLQNIEATAQMIAKKSSESTEQAKTIANVFTGG